MIYKLVPAVEWFAATEHGRFDGSAVDRRDGFIHFSGREQVVESAALYFAGQTGLVLIAVDPDLLGTGLRWEPARRGILFPHLYGHLPLAAVVAVDAVPDDRPVAEAVVALLT